MGGKGWGDSAYFDWEGRRKGLEKVSMLKRRGVPRPEKEFEGWVQKDK